MSVDYLFIGGAPKCGTSTLFDALSNHSEISPSFPKETFYFLEKNHPLTNQKINVHKDQLGGFQSFFNTQKGIKMEATTHLLFTPKICSTIQKLGSCRFLFVLREPADRIFSSYSYTKNNLAKFKQTLSFSEYVEILLSDQVEKLDRYIMPGASRFVLKRELLYSQYERFLTPWKQCIQQDQELLIITFESLIREQEKTLTLIFNWLGLKPYDVLALPRKNDTVKIKNTRIHQIARKINPLITNLGIKKIFMPLYHKLQYQNKEQLSAEDKDSLRKLRIYLEPYNRELAYKFNVGLDYWYKQ